MLSLLLSNPLLLLGAVLTVSPLVIHLLSRRSADRVPFPSLRFLRVTSERTARRRHFEELLLMLLRMLVLAALTLLALPDEMLRNRFFGNRKVGAVVVYDDSLSAGRERVAPMLQAALANVLGSFPPGSAWKLVHNCGPGDGAPYSRYRVHPAETARLAQRATAATDGAGALWRQVAAAVEDLRAAGAAVPEVHVITDGQKREWQDVPAAAPLPGLNLFAFAPPPAVEDNFAVSQVELSARAPLTGEKASLVAALRNFSPRRLRGGLTVFAGGAVADKAALDLGAGASSRNVSDLTLPAGGFAEGFVQISGDSFSGDNRRFFTLPVRPGLDVLIVAPAAGGQGYPPAFYLRTALSPTASFPVRPRVAGPEALASGDLAPYAAVFVLEAPGFTPEVAERMRAYVAAGGTLALLPGVGSDPGRWNAALGAEGLANGGLLPARLAAAATPKAPLADLFPAAPDEELLRPLGRAARDLLKRAMVKKHFPQEIVDGGRAVLNLPGGAPFVTARRYGAGRVVLWGAPPRREWCGLPLRPAFVPLLHAQAWEGRAVAAAEHECGEPLVLAAPEKPADVAGTLVLPDGTREPFAFPAASAAAPARYLRTLQPGIYQASFTQPEKTEKHFAVNFAAVESDLASLGAEELAAKLSPWGKATVSDNLADWEKKREEARSDLDLSSLLALILMALLVAEGAYSWWRARKIGLVGKGAA